MRRGSAREGLSYSEVDIEKKGGRRLALWQECQANSVASQKILLMLRMLCSRKVLYKSFSVPASVEHPFFFFSLPVLKRLKQEV